jgi:hypothetical protein
MEYAKRQELLYQMRNTLALLSDTEEYQVQGYTDSAWYTDNTSRIDALIEIARELTEDI